MNAELVTGGQCRIPIPPMVFRDDYLTGRRGVSATVARVDVSGQESHHRVGAALSRYAVFAVRYDAVWVGAGAVSGWCCGF